jgi:BASS family bile acid:Na+ symporter
VNAELLINLLIKVTLIEMMVTIGLGVRVDDLLRVARDVSLVARAGFANWLCIPAITAGLLFVFDATPMVAAGFLILAGCPGAPYGPPFSAIAKGNVTVAVGLMILLASSSALLAPLVLHVLMPVFSTGEATQVNAMQIVVTLLVTQLMPLSAGVALRRFRPALAGRIQPPLNQISKALNLLIIVIILVVQFSSLAEIRPRGFAGMLLLLVSSWAVGWLVGGRDTGVRNAMTLTTSTRNVAVGLVVAGSAFPGTPAVTAVAAYGLVSLLGTLALATAMSKVART